MASTMEDKVAYYGTIIHAMIVSLEETNKELKERMEDPKQHQENDVAIQVLEAVLQDILTILKEHAEDGKET